MPSLPSTRRKPILFFQPSPDRPLPLWMLFPVFFVAVYLSHLSLLRLPYYWDEAGYYIPAAYDFFCNGLLIPHSTLTNAHPPLPSLLLAGWWSFAGFVPSATRTMMCIVSSLALLGVYRLSRLLTNAPVAFATTLLTALYPVWFTQSTLAHADMFAAAATIWALGAYFSSLTDAAPSSGRYGILLQSVALFSIAAFAKETAIVTAFALAAWEVWRVVRKQISARVGALRALLLSSAVLPLAAWYAYHRHKTGFIFGNPEFLRYNATATLTPVRILLAFAHRVFHATAHMNMFVPTICMIAAMFLPPRIDNDSDMKIARPPARHRGVMLLIILANLIVFSVLGGALLTRYLLPVYPLVLLAAVATWWRRVPHWGWLVAFSALAFFLGLVVNPPYRFAPEDNLAYRDTIVLHQHAIARLQQTSPTAIVLTAWPASDELSKPSMGYVKTPLQVVTVENFTRENLSAALGLRNAASLAFIFSTKYAPAALPFRLGKRNEQWEQSYFGFHEDLSAADAAAVLGGQIIWQEERKGEWAALLALPTQDQRH